MGKECHEGYENLPLTVDEKKGSDSIISKWTEYFEPQRNIFMNDIYSIRLSDELTRDSIVSVSVIPVYERVC